jgi:SnoaL-like domain
MTELELLKEEIREVADRLEIQRVISGATLYSDLGDPARSEALYTDDATLDYSAIFGPDASALPAKVHWKNVRDVVMGLDAATHQNTNFDIEIRGDAAKSASLVRGTLRIGSNIAVSGSIYYHDFVRTKDGWRIARQVYKVSYSEQGNMQELVERARHVGIERRQTAPSSAKEDSSSQDPGNAPPRDERSSAATHAEVEQLRREVRELSDILQIQRVVSRATLLSDLRNYAGSEAMFAKGATLDYSYFFGPDAAALPAALHWANVRQLAPGFDATHHMISNFDIDVRADSATSTSLVRATLRVGGATCTDGGVYIHDLVRTANGWRITRQLFRGSYHEGGDMIEQARRVMQARKPAAS